MKICLAGTGAMGEIHVKALAKINDVQIVSVAGRTEDGVKEFATKWNIPYASTDLTTAIRRSRVQRGDPAGSAACAWCAGAAAPLVVTISVFLCAAWLQNNAPVRPCTCTVQIA